MEEPPIRPPVITRDDLGPRGWRMFHELARLRNRKPRDQVLVLAQYALYHALAGEDVELSRSRLDALFERLEPVA